MRATLSRVGLLMISATALLAAATTATTATTAGAAAGGHIGSGRSPRAESVRWTKVTADGQADFADIGLVRGTNGVLHVIWTGGSTGKTVIYDTPIAPGGQVQPPVIITAHLDQASYPDATAWAGKLHAFWNQISNGSKIFTGTAIATWPAGGRHWNPVTGVSPAINPGWGASVAAATGADGNPWVAFTIGGGFEVSHYGHAKREITVTSCCVYNPGIGADGRTGAAWLTWYASMVDNVGVYAQQLSQNGAKIGAPIRLPGSDTDGDGDQRTTATGLGPGRPGVYVSYLVGSPVVHRVDVVRLGSPTPVVVANANGAYGTTLAADPDGRLWVAWLAPQGLFVRRAAAGASHFGPVQHVPLPNGTAALWKVYINAQSDRLDVLALLGAGDKTAYWATQIVPAS
jgi:hypothetical protein